MERNSPCLKNLVGVSGNTSLVRLIPVSSDLHLSVLLAPATGESV